MKCSDSVIASSVDVKGYHRGRLGDNVFLYLILVFTLIIVVLLVALLILLNIYAMLAI
jgi:hypothetical protein